MELEEKIVQSKPRYKKMSKRKKLLFLPADCIDLNFSRSYYLGRELAKHFDLYWLKFHDRRNQRNGNPIVHSIKNYLKNITQKTEIEKSATWTNIKVPHYSNALVRNLIGEENARKMMRGLNQQILEKVVQQITPEVIFHADNFHFSPPIINKNITLFSDYQDDINFSTYSKKVIEYEREYGSQCFNKTVINFVVSEGAKKNFEAFYNRPFKVLPNGADFQKIRQFTDEDLEKEKKKLGIQDHETVISFIGTKNKFDVELFQRILGEVIDKNYRFLLIGNLPHIKNEKVIQLGTIPSESTYLYYRLSDIGLLPVFPTGNQFIANSMPLKIVQYGAAQKPVVTYPTIANNVEKPGNLFFVKENKPKNWRIALSKAESYSFTKNDNDYWENLSWERIGQELSIQINSTKLIPN